MTKPVSRKMAVDCLLWLINEPGAIMSVPIFLPGSSDTITGERTVFRCPECGEAILPEQRIQFDHRHAHGLNGPHEYKNLRPVHYDPCHKDKSARDVAALAKIDRITGVTKGRKSQKIPAGRKLQSRNTLRRKP